VRDATRANRICQRAGHMFLPDDVIKCLGAEPPGQHCVMGSRGRHRSVAASEFP
jgi:hypothetical protein